MQQYPAIVENALKNCAYRKEYTEVQGLPALREAVASFHGTLENRTITADQILIAPGSKSLLYTIMMAFKKAHLFIPAPAWVSYAPQAQLIGHQTTFMTTGYEHKYRISPELLDRHLSQHSDKTAQKIVVLNYPGNPDGLTYVPEELQHLATILRKHKAYIISDEIYGLLHHRGKHHSIATCYPEGTFVTSGLSKWAGAGGWRLGIAILPENYDPQLKTTMLAIASETYSCAPAPIQHAAITAYSHKDIMTFIQNERIILKAIGNHIFEALQAINIRTHKPEGGFYMLIDFSYYREVLAKKSITADTQLCTLLLQEKGVALLPGSAFGLDPALMTARLAYVDFDGTSALQELETHDWSHDLTVKYAEKMLRGVQKMNVLEWSSPK